MADNLDIVGSVGVDVVPVIPRFHEKLKTQVVPAADRVGEEAGRRLGSAMADHIGTTLGSRLPTVFSTAVTAAGTAAQQSARRQGDDTAGAFSRSLRTRLEAAFRSMPRLDIGIADTGVDAELARIRAKLEQLSRKRIGIDVSAEAARAEVERLEAQLARLGASHPNVQVRADTARARAELRAFREEIDAVDRRTPTVNVRANTGQAQAALTTLSLQLAALSAAPAIPIAAAGIGALASAAVAAGAGVGSLALVAVPAIKDVGAALQAQSAAQADATRSTNAGAAALVAAQQRAIQVANAQTALANAHRSSAQAVASANRQIEQAERGVVDAQRTARDAEEALTQARKDAADQLRDLNDRLRDSALDQEEATLRVRRAQEELTAALADPRATQLQRDEAELSLKRALQGQREQKRSFDDLQKSAEAQRRAGVDGNDAVKAAADRVADAQRNVRDRTQAVADAEKAAADARIQAAEQIASAERGLASARLSAAKSTETATTKADEYRNALEKLTPSGRDLFDAIAGPKGLKSAFSEWSRSLQPTVLPLFTRAVNGVKNSLPGLTPLVLAAADAVGELFDRSSRALASPFWRGFKDDIDKAAKPAIVGLGVAFGNVLTGIAGIIDAFLPHMDGISQRLQRITRRFATWAKSLKGSPEFERFLQYVKDTTPGLAEFLGKVLDAMLSVSQALAPLSTTLWSVLGPVFDAISWIADNAGGAVQILWGLYAVNKAIQLGAPLWAAAMWIYNAAVAGAATGTWSWAAAITATGIVPLIELIVVAVIALGYGIYKAYQNVGWFRTAVDATWNAIKVATVFLWEKILKPAFEGIWWAIKKVGDIAVWLWKSAIAPAFRFIWEAGKILATIIAVVVIGPLYLGFKALGFIVGWLWKNVINPVFGWVADKAVWLFRNVLKPQFDAFMKIVRGAGDVGKWLWKNALKPAFEGIGAVASWLWKKAIKPAFDAIADGAGLLWRKFLKPQFDVLKKGVHLVGDAFKLVRDEIGEQWEKLRSITKKPIEFVINTVYNKGIRLLWNKIADITGAKPLKEFKGFATGGIMPGYTPGRDNSLIAVGGGEAIMRPEWTRAVGADQIHAWNAAARTGGVAGVQRAIANGTPAFSLGGIAGSIWDGIKSTGSAVAGGISTAADFLTNPDKVFAGATKWVRSAMREFASSKWGQMVTDIPVSMLRNLKNSIFGGGGGSSDLIGNIGNAVAGVGQALLWARTQAGKPYQWGGAGNPSFDCSGFMSSIQKVILGKNPVGRLWSTFSFQGSKAPAGWVRNLKSPFQIGITNAGVGHTAGTLAGVNVESRGGRGVVVGSGARGWNDSLFTDHYGFAPALGNAKLYDDGGYLMPGLHLIANGTGKPEPVFTSGQWDDIRAAKSGGGGDNYFDVTVMMGTKDITDIVDVQVSKREAAIAGGIYVGRNV
ncbi:hypothetical protein OG539_16390 [Actinacidiphila glaucinigra]|uniref:hypothetical protein n=1 Tax=Actinacidiphila glaucinigra TaxID=235986 RepID=UPI00324C0F82